MTTISNSKEKTVGEISYSKVSLARTNDCNSLLTNSIITIAVVKFTRDGCNCSCKFDSFTMKKLIAATDVMK